MRRVFVVLGLAALSVGSWAGTAGASHTEGTGPSADFVQGTARLPETSGGGQFHFNVRSGPNGEDPRGMYYAKEGLFGIATFTSEANCLEVRPELGGTAAYIGTVVTRSEEGPQEGDPVIFRVLDRGEPGAGQDQFVGSRDINLAITSSQDCRNPVVQAALTAASQTISQGNFTVHDGQP